jgi:sugar lactone lactonase YvrE
VKASLGISIGLGCLCLLGVAGCAAYVESRPFDTVLRTWPEAPETARIAYVGEFSSPNDLSLNEGFWSALVSLTAGGQDASMVRPMAVATNADGTVIFVSDPDAGCVHRYDLVRGRYRCLSAGEDMGKALAVGLTVTEDGVLFAADSTRGLLWKAGPKDKELEIFFASADIGQPTGVFWSTKLQRLFVADTGKQRILEFDRLGNLKSSFGERGGGPGQMNFPTYVWVDLNDDLLVADSLNFRIQRFDRDATFVYMFGKDGDRPGDFSRPKGVATDSFGNIYVVDALMHLVQVFNPRGQLLLAIGGQGQGQGQFWLPNGVSITADNTIFVADSYNKRVQVFRYIGPGA